jgi:hypothetical protein
MNMATLSVISAEAGISIRLLSRLKPWLDFEEDDFEIDVCHQKALNDLGRRRMTPYVIAYALRCQSEGPDAGFDRYDNLVDIAKARGLSISDAFFDVRSRQALEEILPTAKFWIDQAIVPGGNREAFERIAFWCQWVLKAGPRHAVYHEYLACRLLLSFPAEEMCTYPKKVQSALNKVAFNGFLDGWHRKEADQKGRVRNVYFRPTYDL